MYQSTQIPLFVGQEIPDSCCQGLRVANLAE